MALPQPITIPIETITPIWTGDADRKTSYIKGSSIMGGLRFWTEALLRFLGHHVCDITDEKKRDIFDKEKKKTAICKCCEIFGCTGKGRSFSLKVGGESHEVDHVGTIRLNVPPSPGKRKPPTWYLGNQGPGKGGKDLYLQILPLRPSGLPNELVLALVFMLKYGTIGARDQYGHGLIKPFFNDQLLKQAREAIPSSDSKPDFGLNFGDFFFFKGTLPKPNKFIPFEIRYNVRTSLRVPNNQRDLRHYFCGSIIPNDKNATKYNIGLANNLVRGWGYFPNSNQVAANRNHCLDILKKEVAARTIPNTMVWREFNNPRDITSQRSSPIEYLKDLLEGVWP